MDAPRPAVRFSAVIAEIRALGGHFVAIFRVGKPGHPITKTIFPKALKDLLRMLGLTDEIGYPYPDF